MLGLLATTSCDDDITVTTPIRSNERPRIVSLGPDLENTTFQLRPYDPSPEPYAVVSDPNGLQDIAATYLSYDSLVIGHVIARRADSDPDCPGVIYANNDTLDIAGLLPATMPGRQLVPMEMRGNGLFFGPRFCSPVVSPFGGNVVCDMFPAIRSLREEFVFTPCVSSTEWLDTFVVLPPLVGQPTTVFITEINLVYAGLKVVAVDAGGLSDTMALGDLRIDHMTNLERRFLP